MTNEQSRRVLVVEDEMMIAMLLADMLADLGHEVVGPALRLEQALPLAQEAAIDFAVLDVNLGEGKQSFPVAEVLRERGIPFIFVTGYGTSGLSRAFQGTIALKKPIEVHEIEKAMQQAA